MKNMKEKIIDIILVAVAGFGTFGILTFIESKYFEVFGEHYLLFALGIVAMFFIKEAVSILKDNEEIAGEY